MTKYNTFSNNKSSSFIFKIVKIVHLPVNIFKLPEKHFNIVLTNLIIVESMDYIFRIRRELTPLNSIKPKYPKMSPKPKTEEERLKYRILEQEAENVILKKVART